ncbi:MAG: hypothetical protein RLZZ618_1110 [Pseudomonadota bacterium]|jgi:DNA-binding IclR family transcriptional regulator
MQFSGLNQLGFMSRGLSAPIKEMQLPSAGLHDEFPASLAARAASDSTVAHVPAATRAMALLDLLAQTREAMNVTRLASRLELPKSSVHSLCNTLAARGYLRRQAEGAYFIGPAVMNLAHAFVAQTSAVQEFSSLWRELGAPPEDTVILSLLDGNEVVYVAARHGDRPLGLSFAMGMRLPAHLAASGKAMLAYRDEAAVRVLYPTGQLPAYRGVPAQSLASLSEEFALIRERGWSVDDEGIREGVFCFGAPVFDESGLPAAGIGVCVNKAILKPELEQHNRDLVSRIGAQLTQRLGGARPEGLRR